IVTGTVREDAREPGGYELTASDVVVTAPSVDYPISPKEHGTAFLFEHRHLWLRSKKQVAIARVRHEIEQAIHDFYYARGFIRVDTPILTGSIGEQAGELFATEYFDLGQAYLAQTGQLYGEAAAAAHGKIYTFGPTFRAEKSKTRRHLTEFWMIEPEVAFNDSNANMQLQEDFVSYLVERALERRKEELKELERDLAPLEKVTGPFPRITYSEAIATLQAQGSDIQWGTDLGADDETALAKAYDKPLFVMNYPKEVKAFYMKENPDDPRTVLNNDCLAPEGYGEIIGGSEREGDYDKLLQRIKDQGLDPASYGWYLDLRKYGGFVHSGFGLGLERTVAWICGIPHIREAIAFPRQIHRLYP
ncbi:MAG TPA: asparagine--tRNA ligase, partial [Gemmatimonadales bacterium]|nr:asparagine--tRNA ligase [Gemmatimonadales bacterium]